ncbi:hypothetical protein [Alkalihalobacillus sp. AL-G]|uniref:hypothetical protein n=1 Tax=Alkalihalobacillus sp. AL-G TaxID=2926399 RepID=UPI00272D19CD|nr:hypothetical protein [Alkalihalobacillus sp. AL-G]WLD92076.1 hypothetical protein MOJ78_13675 [Alkalihalobacillus sp. AL-G]
MFNSGMRGFGAGLIVASGLLALVHYQGADQGGSKVKAEEASGTLTYEQVESYLQNEGLVAVKQETLEQSENTKQNSDEQLAEDKKKEKPEEPEEEVIKTTLVISKGTSTGQVCDWLESKKIIKSSDELIQFLRSNNLESKVRFGEYEVNSKMSIAEVATVITSP